MNLIEKFFFLPFDMYTINYTEQYIDLLALFGWNKFPKTLLHFGPLQWSPPLRDYT